LIAAFSIDTVESISTCSLLVATKPVDRNGIGPLAVPVHWVRQRLAGLQPRLAKAACAAWIPGRSNWSAHSVEAFGIAWYLTLA